MRQFHAWFTEAHAAGLVEPNAMVLATADARGVPRARTVLLKGYGPDGLLFFTNYRSRKGRELAANPHGSVVFPWYQLRRQVIVSGGVEYLTERENDAYFATRPRGSQLGAWASGRQSEPIGSRAELLRRFAEFQQRWPEGEPVPRPQEWGGFRLRPVEVEFWQGQANRLHDRFRYVRMDEKRGEKENGEEVGEPGEGTWRIERLTP